MNGACNPCCGNVEPSQEDKNEEKKSKIVSEIVERGVYKLILRNFSRLETIL